LQKRRVSRRNQNNTETSKDSVFVAVFYITNEMINHRREKNIPGKFEKNHNSFLCLSFAIRSFPLDKSEKRGI
jgi:hypothetical protein